MKTKEELLKISLQIDILKYAFEAFHKPKKKTKLNLTKT